MVYVLVQVMVLLGLGGTGGEQGKAYADHSRAVTVFSSADSCEQAKQSLNAAPINGQLFVCIPVAKH